ncbi:MAG: hypothetical protein HYV61_01505 [Candidatus Rokubacteria bacterium]|nr:hypothetical protein [Candidatus Rokubacteria bacterium]MBI2878894.1 hypothetical protein [Candidatus Rokubacteria bacterium]
MGLGEPSVRKALKWVNEQLEENPKADRTRLIDEACRRFDLTPLDADFLYRNIKSPPKE